MIDDVLRTRRTHKSFGSQPVSREVVAELFELARWAPNHHRTNPWRFRVVGPDSLARLKTAAGPAEAPKLDRAPTLVVASAALTGDLIQDEERCSLRTRAGSRATGGRPVSCVRMRAGKR